MRWNPKEKHFKVSEIAHSWGWSTDLIRDIFSVEPGVLKKVRPETKHKRPYTTLSIPESVADRVYRKLQI